MRRYTSLLAVLGSCAFSLSVSCVLAQEGGREPARTVQPLYIYVMQAAAMPGVQKELDLTDDQLEEMAEIRWNFSSAARDRDDAKLRALVAESVKTIDRVLSAAQRNRLKQIHRQTLHTGALLMPDVIAALKLSGEQQKKLQDIDAKRLDVLLPLNKKTDMPETERREKHRQLLKESMDAAMAVLTPSQREEFPKLLGDKFDFHKAGQVPPAKTYGRRKGDSKRAVAPTPQ